MVNDVGHLPVTVSVRWSHGTLYVAAGNPSSLINTVTRPTVLLEVCLLTLLTLSAGNASWSLSGD